MTCCMDEVWNVVHQVQCVCIVIDNYLGYSTHNRA